MGCCDDPTEPVKVSRADIARVQEQYGHLVRELFTDDPEKVILKQLNFANRYLIELAALNAHYDSVRKRAIELLDLNSESILQRIINQQPETEIGQFAQSHLDTLKQKTGILGKIFTG